MFLEMSEIGTLGEKETRQERWGRGALSGGNKNPGASLSRCAYVVSDVCVASDWGARGWGALIRPRRRISGVRGRPLVVAERDLLEAETGCRCLRRRAEAGEGLPMLTTPRRSLRRAAEGCDAAPMLAKGCRSLRRRAEAYDAAPTLPTPHRRLQRGADAYGESPMLATRHREREEREK